jgi:putative tricarboxylic transport membrane protein
MMRDVAWRRRRIMRTATREVWLAVVLLAGGLFFLVHLWRTSGGRWGPAVATTVPTIVMGAFVVLSALLLARALLLRRQLARNVRSQLPAAKAEITSSQNGRSAPWRGIALVSAVVVYLATLPWIGYLAATAMLVGGLALLFGNRRPVSIVLLMLLTPLALYLFFERYMVILLPPGRLFQ